MHARLEAAQEVAGESQRYTLEGDLNLAQREFHAAVDLEGGPGVQQRAEILLVGTDMFTRTRIPPRALRPTTAGSASRSMQAATRGTASRPHLRSPWRSRGCWPTRGSANLAGIEACGDRQGYHVTLAVDPEVRGGPSAAHSSACHPAGSSPVDPAVPEITFDILVDEAAATHVAEHSDRG